MEHLASIACEITVQAAMMNRKNQNRLKTLVQKLYEVHDMHALVKAGLKERFEQLY